MAQIPKEDGTNDQVAGGGAGPVVVHDFAAAVGRASAHGVVLGVAAGCFVVAHHVVIAVVVAAAVGPLVHVFGVVVSLGVFHGRCEVVSCG